MHDPLQSYAALSALGGSPYAGSPYGAPYYGTLNPMGMPYNIQQTSAINPLAAGMHPLAAATLGLSPGYPATINPLLGIPQAGQQGYGPYPAQGFINPQQLQLASALASQAAIPQLLGLSPLAGLQHHPILAALLQNPLITAGLQAQLGQQSQYGQQLPFGQPQFGQQLPFGQQPQFGQQPHSLYSQLGQIGGLGFGQGGPGAGIGYPLAPQSWVGQAGQWSGQGYGQVHPLLAQLTARAYQGQGLSPWGY